MIKNEFYVLCDYINHIIKKYIIYEKIKCTQKGH